MRSGDDGLTGRILPRLALRDIAGERLTIDAAAGPRFALVGLGVAAEALHGAAVHPLWQSLMPTLVPIDMPVPAGNLVHPPTLSLADNEAHLARYAGSIIVLRPDRTVAGIATPDRFARLSDCLQEKFGVPRAELSHGLWKERSHD